MDLNPCEYLWKNHGAYVSSVVNTAQQFIEDGLITEEENNGFGGTVFQKKEGSNDSAVSLNLYRYLFLILNIWL